MTVRCGINSFVTLLSLHWGSLEGGYARSMGMRWVQRAGLIPLRSSSEYPKVERYFSKIVRIQSASSLKSLLLIIIGDSLSLFRKAYFNPEGRDLSTMGGFGVS